jgi:cysteine desulfurase
LRGELTDGLRYGIGPDTMSLWFDRPTGLLLASERVTDDPILGDRRTVTWYTRWQAAGGIKLPRQADTEVNGRLLSHNVVTAATVNQDAADSLFMIPDSMAARANRGPATPPVVSVTLNELAPGVWRAEGGNHFSLVVDQGAGLAVVEAPIGRARPDSVALVTVMWANNEVGTIQPVAEVVEIAHEHGIPVHTDAVQAVGQVEVDFAASGVDALTLTAHKVGGPFGVGALVVRREIDLVPLLHGGGQERDVRSGTIDAPAIRGFATAVELAVERQPEHARRVAALRDDLLRRVSEQVPDAVLNGDANCSLTHRLPGNAHIQFPGCEGDSLLMLLDARGIECSTGSACSAGVPQPSHVLLAMGADSVAARSALRFSLGHTTSRADVDALVEAIAPVVERARAAGMASGIGLASPTAKAG